jgi:hypothetical protein
MAHPVLHKGEEVGQIVARLSFPRLLQKLFQDDGSMNPRLHFLGNDGRSLYSQTGARLDFPPAFDGLGGDASLLRTMPDIVTRLRDWTGPCLVAKASVFGSSLKIFALIPENILLGPRPGPCP